MVGVLDVGGLVARRLNVNFRVQLIMTAGGRVLSPCSCSRSYRGRLRTMQMPLYTYATAWLKFEVRTHRIVRGRGTRIRTRSCRTLLDRRPPRIPLACRGTVRVETVRRVPVGILCSFFPLDMPLGLNDWISTIDPREPALSVASSRWCSSAACMLPGLPLSP